MQELIAVLRDSIALLLEHHAKPSPPSARNAAPAATEESKAKAAQLLERLKHFDIETNKSTI